MCSQAALYYESPAAKVVEIVRDPRLKGSHLGAVEKVRLTADMEGVDGARRERDVVQYYQYSADMVSLFLVFLVILVILVIVSVWAT